MIDMLASATVTEACKIQFVWKMVNYNPAAARAAKKHFRVNAQNQATGRNGDNGNAAWDTWYNGVFQAITDIDYMQCGSERQLSSFGLVDHWVFGTAKDLVNDWIECIKFEPIRNTWGEAKRGVEGLVKATTFGPVLLPVVEPRAGRMHKAWRAQPPTHWSEIGEPVNEYLEGSKGICDAWVAYLSGQRGGVYDAKFH